MKTPIALLGLTLAVGTTAGDDVSWRPSTTLWKGLGVRGEVVAAGPAPAWLTVPKEPLAQLGAPFKSEGCALPPPRELPAAVAVVKGPALPALPPPRPSVAPVAQSLFATSELRTP